MIGKVAVDAPVRGLLPFDIPESIGVGFGVWVEFRRKVVPGIVVEVLRGRGRERIKGVIRDEPVLPPPMIDLGRWMWERYLCYPFEALSPMLPPDFPRKAFLYFELKDNLLFPPSKEDEARFLLHMRRVGRVLAHKLKKDEYRLALSLVRKGVLEERVEQERVKVRGKFTKFLVLEDRERAISELSLSKGKKAHVLKLLLEREALPLKDVLPFKASSLEGVARVEERRVFRDPAESVIPSIYEPRLTELERKIVSRIAQGVDSGGGTYLLFGSRRIDIYIKVFEEAIKRGKRCLYLVPEIWMVEEALRRVKGRVKKVGVLHSSLSPGEYLDEWERIKGGEFDLVIGTRVSLFSPIGNLGVIVVDEEHDPSYKQETSPRYDAREVAKKLSELTNSILIFGSLTPSVETFVRRDVKIFSLPRAKVSDVKVVDMREELKRGNYGFLSRELEEEMGRTLGRGEKVFLFINRRGGSWLYQCRLCGYVPRCDRCLVPLTPHPSESLLICHHCSYKEKLHKECPMCGGELRPVGVGTEGVEEEIRRRFPERKTLRWDRDAGTRTLEAEILIGTTVLRRALSFSSPSLIGVINADTGLYIPDFRSQERIFQLLYELAEGGKKVIIQTFSPEHYAIKYASARDYISFIKEEMKWRRLLKYPPFSRLVRLVFSHRDENTARRKALELGERLKELELDIIGPSPCYMYKVRGKYRWHIILRGENPACFLRNFHIPRGWIIDVDPISLV